MPAIEISDEVMKPSEGGGSGGREGRGRGETAEQPKLRRDQGAVILIADDEQFVLESTKKVLELQGYRTITAKDGAEAVSVYSQSKDMISAVLLDMVMPVMDGATAIQVLHRINPNVKIIAMSGFARRERGEESMKYTQAFLMKPYKADELLETLQKVLTS